MKGIERHSLEKAAKSELAAWQVAIDAIPDYQMRIREGKRQFGLKNRSSNGTFEEVRNSLGEMCSGNVRCMYCEDSFAAQVEHFWPKTVYPDKVFQWLNYLLSCGVCNVAKLNKFEILRSTDSVRYDVTPRRNQIPNQPPAPGTSLLIDPTSEDPADFLWLEMDAASMTRQSLLYIPKPGVDETGWMRADYTIKLLGLNSRALLSKGRWSAYHNFRKLLRGYVHERGNDASPEELCISKSNIQMQSYQTVWFEMKRQRRAYPDLQELFESASEALDW